MIGFILKISFFVIVVMIGLNIFAPEQADTIISKVSQTTSIEKNILQDNLDQASDFTKETVAEVSEKVKETLSE